MIINIQSYIRIRSSICVVWWSYVTSWCCSCTKSKIRIDRRLQLSVRGSVLDCQYSMFRFIAHITYGNSNCCQQYSSKSNSGIMSSSYCFYTYTNLPHELVLIEHQLLAEQQLFALLGRLLFFWLRQASKIYKE